MRTGRTGPVRTRMSSLTHLMAVRFRCCGLNRVEAPSGEKMLNNIN